MHDMNFKTLTLFASQNHPYMAQVIDNFPLWWWNWFFTKLFFSKETPNLYSQFPMYINIERDGSCNVVVFYNSNPSGII